MAGPTGSELQPLFLGNIGELGGFYQKGSHHKTRNVTLLISLRVQEIQQVFQRIFHRLLAEYKVRKFPYLLLDLRRHVREFVWCSRLFDGRTRVPWKHSPNTMCSYLFRPADHMMTDTLEK